MRVLLLGVHQPWASSNLMAEALERNGREVTYIDHRGQDPMGDVAGKHDVAILCKGASTTPQSLYREVHAAAEHKLLFWMDTFNNWRPMNTFAVKDLKWPWTATSSIVMDKIMRATASTKGKRQVQGAYATPSWGCSWDEDPEWTDSRPLVFGSMTPRRKKTLEAIRKRGINVRVLEYYAWGGPLQEEVLKHSCVLGLNNTSDVISVRCHTVAAMGGVILQEALPDMTQDYRGHPRKKGFMKPVVGWKSYDDLVEKIRYIQAGKPVWRGTQTRFCTWARKKFDWHVIMERLLTHAQT